MKQKAFERYIKSTSLRGEDKDAILSIPEYFKGKHNPLFASKTFFLKGDPGIGKTHTALCLVRALDVPTIYCGAGKILEKSAKNFQSIADLNKNFVEQDCLIFLDDLNFIVDMEDGCEVNSEDKRQIMNILAKVKESKHKVILISTVNTTGMFDDAIIDRFDCRILFDAPSIQNKKEFLECKYADAVKDLTDYIANNTVGYNYRDLDEMLRIAYRTGKGIINKESLSSALTTYNPTALDSYSVLRSVEQKFSDIIGRNSIKLKIKRLLNAQQNPELSRKFGLRRSNLVMFYGPPGTGKTMMAKALAGEVGYPLVQVNAMRMLRYGFASEIDNLKRYNNCIIFIDEAEKLFGRGKMNIDDHPFLAEVHTALDGVGSNVNAFIIFAINDQNSFGPTIKDRFSPIHFNLPNAKERTEFLCKKYQSVEDLELQVNPDKVARLTEGMSFRDLEKIWNEIVMDFLETEQLPSEESFSNAVARVKDEYQDEIEKMGMFG